MKPAKNIIKNMEVGRRHPTSYPKGGLLINTDDVGVVKALLKSIGRKIISGNFIDIMKIPRPACISAPLSYLQVIAMDYIYCEYLK